MIKLNCGIFMSFNRSIFFNYSFCYKFFYLHKTSKDSSANCYQDDKERYQSHSEEEKEKKRQYDRE